MPIKTHGKVDLAVLVAHLDGIDKFAERDELVVDPALSEEIGSCAVEVHCRA
jgi:hypothetical protein